MIRIIQSALIAALAVAGASAQAEPKVEVVSRADVEFIPLNPFRGDASPKAGVLWGDIRTDVSSGTLVTFADGFSSPPHIHNITYRAVVIEGEVHNDDPEAEPMWMGPGSFWTQPAGEPHITAVGEGGGTAFLEILSGPYLVQPSQDAFDSGERPINIEERNIVWMDASDVTWIRQNDATDQANPKMAFLWGTPDDGQLNGTFAKFPEGYSGSLRSDGGDLKVVMVQGELMHQAEDFAPSRTLVPGSYFGSEGDVVHDISCVAGTECILYVRVAGRYRLAESE